MSKGKAFNLPHHPRESELHVSVAEFLDWTLIPPTFFCTFPAGWGKLTRGTAGRLYASGLKAGMPDLFVYAPRKIIGIELKVPPNTATAVQRTMFAKLQAVGIRVYICTCLEDVAAALQKEGIQCRLVINDRGALIGRRTELNAPVPPDISKEPISSNDQTAT